MEGFMNYSSQKDYKDKIEKRKVWSNANNYMVLSIEHKPDADTEDKMTELLASLLMVRSTAFMASKFVEACTELHEGYNDLLIAFDTIRALIEPALSYFTYEMLNAPKKRVKKGA